MYVVLNPVRPRCHWGGASDPSAVFFVKVPLEGPFLARRPALLRISQHHWGAVAKVLVHLLHRQTVAFPRRQWAGCEWTHWRWGSPGKVPNEGPKIGVWEEFCR